MEIVQPDVTGERPITAHGPGEFTREITMISWRCLVRGRVTEAASCSSTLGTGHVDIVLPQEATPPGTGTPPKAATLAFL